MLFVYQPSFVCDHGWKRYKRELEFLILVDHDEDLEAFEEEEQILKVAQVDPKTLEEEFDEEEFVGFEPLKPSQPVVEEPEESVKKVKIGKGRARISSFFSFSVILQKFWPKETPTMEPLAPPREGYTLEIIYISIVVVYAAVFLFGRNANQKIANGW